MRKVTSMRGRPSIASGMISKPVTRPERAVPARRDAGKLQRHGKFLAGGAHGRRAPEIDDEALRPVAVILQMPAQQLFGEPDALRMRGSGRHAARIDREQIAPGGQHVAAAAPGRAGRTRRDTLARERVEQRVPLLFAAGAAPEHMQAVAELAFLQIADEAVDARDRFGRRG